MVAPITSVGVSIFLIQALCSNTIAFNTFRTYIIHIITLGHQLYHYRHFLTN